MKNIRSAINEIDSRIIIQNLETVEDYKGSIAFLSLLIPFCADEAALTSLEFEILDAVCKAGGCSCVITMNQALAA